MATKYQARPYRHPDDLAAVLNLVRARPAQRADDYPSLADVRELLCRPGIRANSCLWLADGDNLAGYAYNDHYPDFSGISFEAAPGHKEIEGEMIDWCLDNFRQHRQAQASQLQLSVATANISRIELLQAYGFQLENWSLVKMTRLLSNPIPTPQLPEGFAIRQFRGEEEMDEWIMLHRTAFGTQNLTADRRRSWMQVPGYNPALDLVAVAPNEKLASYVFFAIHPEENERSVNHTGTVDSIGTLPAFRRMGLARVLLLTGLAVLKACGMGTASLITASYNAAMQQSAYRVGFQKTGEILYFAKPITGTDRSISPKTSPM